MKNLKERRDLQTLKVLNSQIPSKTKRIAGKKISSNLILIFQKLIRCMRYRIEKNTNVLMNSLPWEQLHIIFINSDS